MLRKFQFGWCTIAGLLLASLPGLAQVQFGDLSMHLNGSINAGYTGDYGTPINSAHNMSFGGNGAFSGSYYNPNFFSFSLSPYYDRSSANSESQSISAASGFNFTSGIFAGSHFPGSISYARSYNSQDNLAVPGVADFTTHGNSSTFALNWSELLPDVPSLSFGYQQGNSDYSVYGANDMGNSHNRSFNLRSGYVLEGFNLNGYYSNGTSQSLIPQVVGNTPTSETTDSDTSSYGFGVSHKLPFRGQFSSSVNRSDFNTDYLGYKYNGTVDTVATTVGAQPTNKLHVGFNTTYSDNLTGLLYQSSVVLPGSALQPSEGSHSLDLLGTMGYSITDNLHSEFYTDRRTQHYFGQDYGATAYGAGVSYGHPLFGGAISTSAFLIDNTVDHSDENSLGVNTSVGYNRRVGDWFLSGSLSYAQNVESLLVSYTNSYYNYSVHVRRRFTRRLVWSAGAGFSQTGLTAQPHAGNHTQSYSSGLGYGQWISVNGSYSKSDGHGLISGGGLTPVPLPPVIPENLLISYGGTGYSYSVGSSPLRRLSLAASYSRGDSNIVNAGLASRNYSKQYNTYFTYQFRKMYLNGGYARLMQGFSASGLPPSDVSSFYVGVGRWFNFF